MTALLLVWALLQGCEPMPLTQSVVPSSFQKVSPGETVFAGILIENTNPPGCPAVPVTLAASSQPPTQWMVMIEGGASWIVAAGATAFTRLHMAVPRDATTGSYQVTYTLAPPNAEPFVTPLTVNVQK